MKKNFIYLMIISLLGLFFSCERDIPIKDDIKDYQITFATYIEADKQDKIENYLVHNYFVNENLMWRNTDSDKWELISPEDYVISSGIMESKNVDTDSIPQIFKLMPPTEQIHSHLKWVYKETGKNARIFYVFIVRGKPTRHKLYFYEDLTQQCIFLFPNSNIKSVILRQELYLSSLTYSSR